MSQDEIQLFDGADEGPTQLAKLQTIVRGLRTGLIGPSVPNWAERGLQFVKDEGGNLGLFIADGLGGEVPVGGGGGGWEELDAGTGTWGGVAATPMYDFAVDGSFTTNIPTPNFEDGYEYMLIVQGLSCTSNFGLNIELFFETSAVWRSPAGLATPAGAGSADAKIVINSPRIASFGCKVDAFGVEGDGSIVNVNETVTNSPNTPVRQKIGAARISVGNNTTDAGVIRLYRRPMPGSAA